MTVGGRSVMRPEIEWARDEDRDRKISTSARTVAVDRSINRPRFPRVDRSEWMRGRLSRVIPPAEIRWDRAIPRIIVGTRFARRRITSLGWAQGDSKSNMRGPRQSPGISALHNFVPCKLRGTEIFIKYRDALAYPDKSEWTIRIAPLVMHHPLKSGITKDANVYQSWKFARMMHWI
jgi:hypothetical protein